MVMWWHFVKLYIGLLSQTHEPNETWCFWKKFATWLYSCKQSLWVTTTTGNFKAREWFINSNHSFWFRHTPLSWEPSSSRPSPSRSTEKLYFGKITVMGKTLNVQQFEKTTLKSALKKNTSCGKSTEGRKRQLAGRRLTSFSDENGGSLEKVRSLEWTIFHHSCYLCSMI